MRTFRAFVLMMMVGALVLVTTGSLFRAGQTVLGDRSLALIHGGNDNSLTNSAGLACELLTTQGTDVYPKEMCPYLEDGTDCLSCATINANTQVPNSQGGPGAR